MLNKSNGYDTKSVKHRAMVVLRQPSSVVHLQKSCNSIFSHGGTGYSRAIDVVGDELLEDDKTRYDPKQWISEQGQRYGMTLCFGCHAHGRLDE